MPNSEKIPDLSEVCLVGGELTEFNLRKFPELRRLDLSYNVISKFKGLEDRRCTESLEELLLDNNRLESLEIESPLVKLHTLSLNKNKISNLPALIISLASNTPKLRYLSLLGNPCCPDQLSHNFVDDSDYQIYRYYVLHHLPLKFLDHRPVTQGECFEARKPLYGSLPARSKPTLLPASSAPSKKSRQGKRKFTYTGKNSEGNRFIKDEDL